MPFSNVTTSDPNARDGSIKVFNQVFSVTALFLLPTYIPSDQDSLSLWRAAAREQKHPRKANFGYVTHCVVQISLSPRYCL